MSYTTRIMSPVLFLKHQNTGGIP